MNAVSTNLAQFPVWKTKLAKRKNGEPYGDERNVIIALEESAEFIGAFMYDAFADQIKLMRPPPWLKKEITQRGWTARQWSDNDRIELQAWLQSEGLPVNKASVVQDAVIVVAQRWRFHPVQDYLQELRWDGKPRLDHWLEDYLGATDNDRYLKAIGAKFMIGAVARAMEPGCQMDTMLVLEGAQGIGKSSAVRALFGSWTSDVAHDMASKDAAILIQGIWGGELSEMTAMAKSLIETVKAFISRRVDRYRPPYGRNAIDRPRQTVFIATTNECEYLQDATGGRRFWPVDCEKIDVDALDRDRDQLWAEAMHRYRAKETWHLARPDEALAFREQQHRRRVSPMETQVLEYADRMLDQSRTRIDMRSILQYALGVDPENMGPSAGTTAREAGRILTSNGWIRFKPVGRGKNRTVWYEYKKDRDPFGDLSDSQGEKNEE
jgi:predicted P-loop ATPase